MKGDFSGNDCRQREEEAVGHASIGLLMHPGQCKTIDFGLLWGN